MVPPLEVRPCTVQGLVVAIACPTGCRCMQLRQANFLLLLSALIAGRFAFVVLAEEVPGDLVVVLP